MLPIVECVGCGRQVRCIRVEDGTVYRPFAWKFEEADPMRGLCGECVLGAEFAARINGVERVE